MTWAAASEGNRVWAGFVITGKYATPVSLNVPRSIMSHTALERRVFNWKQNACSFKIS